MLQTLDISADMGAPPCMLKECCLQCHPHDTPTHAYHFAVTMSVSSYFATVARAKSTSGVVYTSISTHQDALQDADFGQGSGQKIAM